MNASDTDGSSPRAWEPRAKIAGANPYTRFIPACTGTTWKPTPDATRDPVHPRMHGDHPGPDPFGVRHVGSSPHARGPLLFHPELEDVRRFIPACTGTTPCIPSLARYTPVHPRMHGDHWNWSSLIMNGFGSSPHARGPLVVSATNICSARFIPACTGTTSADSSPHSPSSVHPRMHGDHCLRCHYRTLLHGSSPHARGPPRVRRRAGPRVRFIPACTGTTSSRTDVNAILSVHPRMHGDHAGDAYGAGERGGSSPHARGPRGAWLPLSSLRRFIPACTGTTRHLCTSCFIATVHPRMHGDHAATNSKT